MANFGIGIGAFADGFARGMNIGDKYRQASKQWEIEKAQEAAVDEAKAAREAQIEEQSAAMMRQDANQGDALPSLPEALEAAGVQASPVKASNVQPTAGSDALPSGGQPAASGLPRFDSYEIPVTSNQVVTQAAPAERTIETPRAAQAPAAKPSAAAAVLGASNKPMTKEQARKVAEKSVPSVLEFMQKQGAPRVAEAYLRQGNIQKAEEWTQWAEGAEGKRTMKTWAKAWSATQRGDIEGAANHVFDLYKSFDDGSTPVSKETVKDKAGNVTGFNIRLRDDATGEERDTFVGRDQLLEMGTTALSPPQMFERAYAAKQASEAAKAKAAEKAGEIQMQTAKEIAVEQARQGGRVELEGIKTQNEAVRDAQKHEYELARDVNKSVLDSGRDRNKVQQELDAKVGALQKAGYSEEFIKNALPDILGVNQYKKTTSPEEAKRLAFSDRMKNDPSFGRKPAEQQRQIIEQDMALIYGGAQPSAVAPSGQIPAARGLPVLDKTTGKIIYR